MSRERTPREMAIAWAQEWLKDIEDGGAGFSWRRNPAAAWRQLPED